MFGERLKKLREERNISQYELSEAIRVSRSSIAKWENGNGIPSNVNLDSLCKYFEVSEEYLLSREDYKKETNKYKACFKNILFHSPIIIVDIIAIFLTVVELFVFVREGNYVADNGYYPALSILTILKAYSLIPIGIYFLVLIFNILFSFNGLSINDKNRKLVIILTIVLVLSTYIVSFIISYSLVKPYNYGMFWQPHLIEI